MNEEGYYHLVEKADGIIIRKKRYLIPYKEFTIELDVFEEPYENLVIAEVEFESEDQANAFKHAMWNAVMTDKMGEKKAKEFADAHEEDYLSSQPKLCEMDLFNNELGRQIAIKYAGQGYDVFAQKIYEAINEGEAYVIEWSK